MIVVTRGGIRWVAIARWSHFAHIVAAFVPSTTGCLLFHLKLTRKETTDDSGQLRSEVFNKESLIDVNLPDGHP